MEVVIATPDLAERRLLFTPEATKAYDFARLSLPSLHRDGLEIHFVTAGGSE